jgi:hypothetical protein
MTNLIFCAPTRRFIVQFGDAVVCRDADSMMTLAGSTPAWAQRHQLFSSIRMTRGQLLSLHHH